tara:strand:- start:19007 stop:20335 length:1329 start_codon:yes stop_codon:yes gene_type:complete
MLNTQNKTIYALSSASGRAGLSIIRISGSNALNTQELLGFKIGKPRESKFCKLLDQNTQETIDNSLVTYFKSPKSFTGEDVIEISVHGGKAILDKIFAVLSKDQSFSYAQPGEFTRRAFINGKLDLLAVEGLGDIINAETEFQRKQAYDQMEGRASELYNGWTDRLVKSLSYIEATIDFTEEDIPENLLSEQILEIEEIYREIQSHLNDNRRGERLRDGYKIIIAGPPNTGKSSLFNHLSNRDIAIVSPSAGTTRDSLEVHLDIKGFPVTVIDTAGIRKSQSKIEEKGIQISEKKMQDADLILWLRDSSKKKNMPVPKNILDKTMEVWTKADININKKNNKKIGPLISTKEDIGFTQLIDIIAKKVELGCRNEGQSITRSRHRDALQKAINYLSNIVNDDHLEIEVIAEELRLAVISLSRITGKVDVEDLLEVIFADFCIGK